MTEPRSTPRADASGASGGAGQGPASDEGPGPPLDAGFEAYGPPPPRGGQGRELPPLRGLPDLSPLVTLLDGLRRALPAELQEQFTALVRELLLTLRSLIDWYLERLDGDRREPRVEDIPID